MKIKTEHIIIALALGTFALNSVNNNQNGRNYEKCYTDGKCYRYNSYSGKWYLYSYLDENGYRYVWNGQKYVWDGIDPNVCIPIGEGENCW